MSTLTIVALIVAVDLIIAGFTAYLASEKGYSSTAWFWIGVSFSLLAFVTAVGLPKKP